MACRIGELVLGRRDPEVLARFWCCDRRTQPELHGALRLVTAHA